MLIVAEKGREQALIDIFEKWDINAVVIGKVTSDGMLRVKHHGNIVAEIPASSLVLGGGAPVYYREAKEKKPNTNFPTLKKDSEINFEKEILKLLAHPNIASKRWVYTQYDSMVRTNTAVAVGASDAAVVRIKGTKKALAMKTDCNSKYVYLNPRKGGKIAVAECARNVACTGARPLGVTNCLNFGNPYKPDVYFQFKEAVAGMGEACLAFDTPVTGGNVSFYNETLIDGKATAVFPTPTIGIVGLLEDVTKAVTATFKHEGDIVMLLGESKLDLNGSQFLEQYYNELGNDAPFIDLIAEKKLQDLLIELAEKQLLQSAHDVSDGGIVIALIESAIMDETHQKGATVNFDATGDFGVQEILFSESQGRVVISVKREQVERVQTLARNSGVPCQRIGEVKATHVEIAVNGKSVLNHSLQHLADIYFNAVEREIGALV
jgi:phosphoribosylformylglycinamidine synthase